VQPLEGFQVCEVHSIDVFAIIHLLAAQQAVVGEFRLPNFFAAIQVNFQRGALFVGVDEIELRGGGGRCLALVRVLLLFGLRLGLFEGFCWDTCTWHPPTRSRRNVPSHDSARARRCETGCSPRCAIHGLASYTTSSNAVLPLVGHILSLPA
jgi:hypothetical protein